MAFALQQGLEGFLWVKLEAQPGMQVADSALVFLFLSVALGFWPTYIPLAAILAEQKASRRKMMLPFVLAGACLSVALVWHMNIQPAGASIQKRHIQYGLDFANDLPWAVAYLAVVAIPLLGSSHRAVRILGVVVIAGAAVSFILDREAYISVWCFFAAGASVVVILHFETERRRRLASRPMREADCQAS